MPRCSCITASRPVRLRPTRPSRRRSNKRRPDMPKSTPDRDTQLEIDARRSERQRCLEDIMAAMKKLSPEIEDNFRFAHEHGRGVVDLVNQIIVNRRGEIVKRIAVRASQEEAKP